MRTMVSLASEPELAKKKWSRPGGVSSASLRDSAATAGVVVLKKVL